MLISDIITLYHISFDDSLEGIWEPMIPAGVNKSTAKYQEPNTPRICCATSIGKCLVAIWGNVRELMITSSEPKWANFTVYSPQLTGNERIWGPEYLTKEKLVQDAWLTKEYDILDPVFMKKIGEVEVQQIQRGTEMKLGYAFQDTDEDSFRYLDPRSFKIRWVQT